MNMILRCVGMLLIASLAFAVPSYGQPAPAPPVTVENYYKLIPGAGKDWLELYKKNHDPILQQLVKDGILKSKKLYARRFHAAQPPWDYKVVLMFRDWAAMEEARRREPDIARALYPDQAEHARAEKHRWELTDEHWDDVLTELPLE